MDSRIGIGSDIHRLVEGRKLILGNIEIPHHKGFEAHSDGDALIHAICDALLGALALRDIGFHFPDDDPQHKGQDSAYFLEKVVSLIRSKGFEIGNLDTIISIEKPKMRDYIPLMVKRLAQIMSLEENQVSIKAKTAERMGFVGHEEGVHVQAVVILHKNNDQYKN